MLLRASFGLVRRWNAVSQLRCITVNPEEEIKRSEALFSPTKYKPPLEIYGPSGLYASACWSAAAQADKLDLVEKEMADVKKLIDFQPDFIKMLSDPTQLRKTRIHNVSELFSKAGVSYLLKNLFVVMAQNNRLQLIPKVIADYTRIMKAHRKETTVIVTTAKELDKNDQKQLQASLSAIRFSEWVKFERDRALGKRIGTDQKISMEMVVDPEIIGGLIVEWDDAYRMDLSVARSIKRLEADLLGAL